MGSLASQKCTAARPEELLRASIYLPGVFKITAVRTSMLEFLTERKNVAADNGWRTGSIFLFGKFSATGFWKNGRGCFAEWWVASSPARRLPMALKQEKLQTVPVGDSEWRLPVGFAAFPTTRSWSLVPPEGGPVGGRWALKRLLFRAASSGCRTWGTVACWPGEGSLTGSPFRDWLTALEKNGCRRNGSRTIRRLALAGPLGLILVG